MPKIAELREIDGEVWARVEMELGSPIELLSPAEIEANHKRTMAYLDEIDRLRAALQDAVDSCCECGGTGNAFTMEDETQIGQAPGSSRIDCPCCSKQRAALGDITLRDVSK